MQAIPDWAVAVSARLVAPDRALIEPVATEFVRRYFEATQEVTSILRELGRRAPAELYGWLPMVEPLETEVEVLPLAEVAVGERVAVMTSWAWCWPVVRIAAR